MRTLLLLRHAKSSWKHPGLSDHDRPLNRRGKRDAPRIGRLLREQRLLPDVILCSSAKRARQTADAVAQASGSLGGVEVESRLYLADADAIIEVVRHRGADAERVLVVGHNPGLELVVGRLAGEDDLESLPTAALVHFGLDIASWTDLQPSTRGRLVNVWRPKELGGE